MHLAMSLIMSNGSGRKRETIIAGEALLTRAGAAIEWIVPAGVYSVCVVCVGSGSAIDPTTTGRSHFNNALIANGSSGSVGGSPSGHDGGGMGGRGGGIDERPAYPGGGGGAGGYSGDGGNGASGTFNLGRTAGNGGGGAGGANRIGAATFGGGVGLYGEGPSGSASGEPGSNGVESKYGGGITGGRGTNGGGGGALGYKNDIEVFPGQRIPIQAGAVNGAVRIIWGPGRAFPSTLTTEDVSDSITEL